MIFILIASLAVVTFPQRHSSCGRLNCKILKTSWTRSFVAHHLSLLITWSFRPLPQFSPLLLFLFASCLPFSYQWFHLSLLVIVIVLVICFSFLSCFEMFLLCRWPGRSLRGCVGIWHVTFIKRPCGRHLLLLSLPSFHFILSFMHGHSGPKPLSFPL